MRTSHVPCEEPSLGLTSGGCYVQWSLAELIPLSLQLHTQVTLANLDRRHMGEWAKSCARRSACFCSQSGVSASILLFSSYICNHATEVGGPLGFVRLGLTAVSKTTGNL